MIRTIKFFQKVLSLSNVLWLNVQLLSFLEIYSKQNALEFGSFDAHFHQNSRYIVSENDVEPLLSSGLDSIGTS